MCPELRSEWSHLSASSTLKLCFLENWNVSVPVSKVLWVSFCCLKCFISPQNALFNKTQWATYWTKYRSYCISINPIPIPALVSVLSMFELIHQLQLCTFTRLHPTMTQIFWLVMLLTWWWWFAQSPVRNCSLGRWRWLPRPHRAPYHPCWWWPRPAARSGWCVCRYGCSQVGT